MRDISRPGTFQMPTGNEIDVAALTAAPVQQNLAGGIDGRMWASSLDPESGQMASGWYYPWEVVDESGARVYDDYSPEVQGARQQYVKYRAQQVSAQNKQLVDTRAKGAEAYKANQMAGGLQAAGFEFAPGALQEQGVRDFITGSMGNPAAFSGQGASNFMRRPLQQGRNSWDNTYSGADLDAAGIAYGGGEFAPYGPRNPFRAPGRFAGLNWGQSGPLAPGPIDLPIDAPQRGDFMGRRADSPFQPQRPTETENAPGVVRGGVTEGGIFRPNTGPRRTLNMQGPEYKRRSMRMLL